LAWQGATDLLRRQPALWDFEDELAYSGNATPQHTNGHGYPVALVGVQITIMLADLFHMLADLRK
jgi:hypothetical protein